MRRALTLAAALALVAGAVSAQTTEGALKEFGLFATWAEDCAKPPSKDNIHSRYEMRDGQAVNVHDAGPTFFEEVYVVRSAKPTGIDLLLMQVIAKSGAETLITMRRIGDKMQVWRVAGADGKTPVSDGKFTANDAAIPALSKCK